MTRCAGLQNVWKALLVFLGKAIRRTLGRRCFEVIHMPRFRLEFNHASTHMIEQPHGHIVPFCCRDVFSIVREVADHFV